MIGRVIQHFEILRELGHGGMGKVFEANDQMLDRRVAIKVLHPAMDQDPNLVQRFQKEAKALGRLKHPNVTSVFSFFRSEDQFFLVMELVPGERLDEFLQRRPLLPWEEAVGIACAVLDGLAHAHDQGLLHRDVKAGNCLITPEGEVKLSDFGIAQVVGGTRLTRQGGVVGTPEYMSPEQIQGKPLDARTDIYSLGIVLYEMVAGQAPFRSESTYEVMRAQIEMLPTPPRALRLEIPPWLETVILKSLAKDPEQRFSSAAEFATFLRQGCAPSTGPSGIDTGINTGTNTGIDSGAQTTVLEPPPPALRPTVPLPRTALNESPTVARETGETVQFRSPRHPSSRQTRRFAPLAVAAFMAIVLLTAGAVLLHSRNSDQAPKTAKPRQQTSQPSFSNHEDLALTGPQAASPPSIDDEGLPTSLPTSAQGEPAQSEPSQNKSPQNEAPALQTTPIRPSRSRPSSRPTLPTPTPAQAPAEFEPVQKSSPPPPWQRTTPAAAVSDLESIMRPLRTSLRQFCEMGRSHKGIRKEVRALDATFEDLEDELDDLRKVKDFDDLEDLEDEARKLVKKGQRLKEKLPQVRLTPTILSNWRKVDDQLKRLDRLLSSWREAR